MALLTETVDAAHSTATGYALALDDLFDGAIGPGDAGDWVAVDLVAGQSYVFSVWGRDGAAGLDDTHLALFDGTGGMLDQNDDVALSYGNFFSLITHEATSTGTHYLEVRGFGSDTGRYTLQVADDIYTHDQIAGYMRLMDWGVPAPLAFPGGQGAEISYDISGLDAAGRQLAEWAFEIWSSYTGLGFTETAGAADITLDDNQPGAAAGPDDYDTDTGELHATSVNVSADWLDDFGTAIGSYSFQTYLHEIGHALGLGHAGPYDGIATYGVDNIYRNDSTQASVMSYFSLADNDYLPGGNLAIITPMVADLIAMQASYGMPSVHAGDTVWGAGNNLGGWLGDVLAIVFDDAPADPDLFNDAAIGFTVFDTGGHDLLDLSTIGEDQRIDLRPERASDVAGARGNMVIARDTVIEDARAGGGNDNLRGNSADNVLEGRGGNDTVLGDAGDDTLRPGTGDDLVQGGPGDDVLHVEGGADTFVGGPGDDTLWLEVARAAAVATETDTGVDLDLGGEVIRVSGVETFRFADQSLGLAALLGEVPGDGTEGPDTLIGTEGPDTLDGLAGDDLISGLAGDDLLIGGPGDDTIAGSEGNDRVRGGEGADRLGGGPGDDVITGGADDDVIGGGQGDDSASGEAGHDVVNGGAGDDTLTGGAGDDTMGAGFNDDLVQGGEGADSMGGGTGRDTMEGGTGDDAMGGGEGNDTLFGGAGDDRVNGGGRHDRLFGDTGDDSVNGGAGHDTMTGGEGADTFLFNAFLAGDADVITDFEDGTDLLRMTGVTNAPGSGLAGKLAALDATDVSSGVLLSHQGQTILLEGMTAAQLDLDDFVFL